MPESLFDQTVSTPTIDESKDFLSELVGDGKKFKDVKDLAKGKAFSDAHIVSLEQTLDRLKAELQTRKTAEELIDKINQKRINPDSTPIPDNRNLDDDTQTPLKSGQSRTNAGALTPEDVEKMFLEREARRRKDDNLTLASQKLRDIHGDAAAGVLQAKAQELGLDTTYLKNMAQEAPNAFLALFSKPASVQQDVFSAPPSSSFRPQTTNSLTEKWSTFNEVKKANPRLYESAGFQKKIMEAGERAAQAGRFEEFMNS